MTEITQPHDHFFRRTFSDPDIVEDILFNNLPQIATHLVPGSLGNTGESFVTPELREYVSDMLYRAQLKRGTGAYLYLLFEHKSHPEPRVAFDLLRYMVRIWERIRDQGASERLPHVIPIVFYHGKERWNGDTNFAGLFEQIEELREYVPTFEYCLYDLSQLFFISVDKVACVYFGSAFQEVNYFQGFWCIQIVFVNRVAAVEEFPFPSHCDFPSIGISRGVGRS